MKALINGVFSYYFNFIGKRFRDNSILFKNICGEIEDKEVMKPISTIRFADTIETLVLDCIADNVIELLSFSIFTNRELLSNEQVKVIRNFINSSNQKIIRT